MELVGDRISMQFVTNFEMIKQYKPQNKPVQFIPMKIQIDHDDMDSVLRIQEGTGALTSITKKSQLSSQTKPVLLQIIKHFFPHGM